MYYDSLGNFDSRRSRAAKRAKDGKPPLKVKYTPAPALMPASHALSAAPAAAYGSSSSSSSGGGGYAVGSAPAPLPVPLPLPPQQQLQPSPSCPAALAHLSLYGDVATAVPVRHPSWPPWPLAVPARRHPSFCRTSLTPSHRVPLRCGV